MDLLHAGWTRCQGQVGERRGRQLLRPRAGGVSIPLRVADRRDRRGRRGTGRRVRTRRTLRRRAGCVSAGSGDAGGAARRGSSDAQGGVGARAGRSLQGGPPAVDACSAHARRGTSRSEGGIRTRNAPAGGVGRAPPSGSLRTAGVRSARRVGPGTTGARPCLDGAGVLPAGERIRRARTTRGGGVPRGPLADLQRAG